MSLVLNILPPMKNQIDSCAGRFLTGGRPTVSRVLRRRTAGHMLSCNVHRSRRSKVLPLWFSAADLNPPPDPESSPTAPCSGRWPWRSSFFIDEESNRFVRGQVAVLTGGLPTVPGSSSAGRLGDIAVLQRSPFALKRVSAAQALSCRL